MLQPKDIDWLNGYKNKTHIYAVYKGTTSDPKTHTDWKWGDEKKYSMQTEMEKKAGGAILISDKVDFKTKTNRKQRRSLHNDKGIK